jgi:hypothetical protein
VAQYKVPQDVEAEDKLIGPLSFRQFVYLMVAGGGAFVGFFLFQLSPFLIILVLPIVVLFGVLALPLRKDQPMEVYLVALIRFFLKPRRRIWNPDGMLNYVEITSPRSLDAPFSPNYAADTAAQRLDYLSRIMDSRGWSLKGVSQTNQNVSPVVMDEAARATDIMDEHADLAKSFDDLIAKKNQENRQTAIAAMQQAANPSAAPGKQQVGSPQPLSRNPYQGVLQRQFGIQPAADQVATAAPRFNPYPTIHQKVIDPSGQSLTIPQPNPQASVPTKPVTAPVSPAIMRLANSNNLSISTLAREAHRLQPGDEGEVVIQLH